MAPHCRNLPIFRRWRVETLLKNARFGIRLAVLVTSDGQPFSIRLNLNEPALVCPKNARSHRIQAFDYVRVRMSVGISLANRDESKQGTCRFQQHGGG